MAAIQLEGLRKEYGDVVALDGIDMTVEEGEVFGFLGPNGAGKSTTIDLILDYLRPTAGSVRVFGESVQQDPVGIRHRTGILPEDFRPFTHTTGREHVAFAMEARGVDGDPDEILERVGLEEDGHRNATGYSTGMTQRMALGMALVGDPDLLILDEPSSGLDPHGVRRMREIVTTERDRGATVFFSSHILPQVEAVADRVGIVDEGELIAVDTIDALRDRVGGGDRLSVTLDRAPSAVESTVASVPEVTIAETDGDTISVNCPDERKVAVIDAVREAGASVLDIETSETSLEDLFVAQTNAADANREVTEA